MFVYFVPCITPGLILMESWDTHNFNLIYTGFVNIETKGVYQFAKNLEFDFGVKWL